MEKVVQNVKEQGKQLQLQTLKREKNMDPKSLIVGIIIGIILTLGLICLFLWWIFRKQPPNTQFEGTQK